ncbi:MAG: hypothetical protein JW738_08770 [Actinobacteria bacterium]|nr:hypothetical protein [Actinomycetota bacterium]
MRRRKDWHFFWKNFCWLGRMIRMEEAGVMFIMAYLFRKNILLALMMGYVGMEFMFEAVMRWSPYRAILKMPSGRAYKKKLKKLEARKA